MEICRSWRKVIAESVDSSLGQTQGAAIQTITMIRESLNQKRSKKRTSPRTCCLSSVFPEREAVEG
jgi:hypothetical protein